MATNASNNDPVHLATTIEPGGPGLVTAGLLYEYMRSFKQSLASEPINWDVPSIRIKNNGREVLMVSNGSVHLGNYMDYVTVQGKGMSLNATELAIHAMNTFNVEAPSVNITNVRGDNVLHASRSAIRLGNFEQNVSVYGGSLEVGGTRLALHGEEQMTLGTADLKIYGTQMAIEGDMMELRSRGKLFAEVNEMEMHGSEVLISGYDLNFQMNNITGLDNGSSSGPGENPTSIDWSLDQLKINVGGNNVLRADSNGIQIGNSDTPLNLKAAQGHIESADLTLQGSHLSLFAFGDLETTAYQGYGVQKLYGDVRLMDTREASDASTYQLGRKDDDQQVVYFND